MGLESLCPTKDAVPALLSRGDGQGIPRDALKEEGEMGRCARIVLMLLPSCMSEKWYLCGLPLGSCPYARNDMSALRISDSLIFSSATC